MCQKHSATDPPLIYMRTWIVHGTISHAKTNGRWEGFNRFQANQAKLWKEMGQRREEEAKPNKRGRSKTKLQLGVSSPCIVLVSELSRLCFQNPILVCNILWSLIWFLWRVQSNVLLLLVNFFKSYQVTVTTSSFPMPLSTHSHHHFIYHTII